MNKFDFNQFNNLTGGIPTGLKVALAEGLLRDAEYSLRKFNNPLAEDAESLITEVKTFRVKYKTAAEAKKNKVIVDVKE